MHSRIQEAVVLAQQFRARIAAEGAEFVVGIRDEAFDIGHRDDRVLVDGVFLALQFLERGIGVGEGGAQRVGERAEFVVRGGLGPDKIRGLAASGHRLTDGRDRAEDKTVEQEIAQQAEQQNSGDKDAGSFEGRAPDGGLEGQRVQVHHDRPDLDSPPGQGRLAEEERGAEIEQVLRIIEVVMTGVVLDGLGEIIADFRSGQGGQESAKPRGFGAGQHPQGLAPDHDDFEDIRFGAEGGDDALQFADARDAFGGVVHHVGDQLRALLQFTLQLLARGPLDRTEGEQGDDSTAQRHRQQQLALERPGK